MKAIWIIIGEFQTFCTVLVKVTLYNLIIRIKSNQSLNQNRNKGWV